MIRKFKDIKEHITKDKSSIKEIFHPNNSPINNESLALAVVPPGKSTKAHIHQKSEEIYFVLEGKGIITLDRNKHEINKHDSILLKKGVKHSIENIGEEDLKFLCICSPAYEHEDTYLDSST